MTSGHQVLVDEAHYNMGFGHYLGSSGRRNSTVLKGFHAPPMLLDTRLARARGARKKEKERSGFLMSPNPRESEATEGR